MARWLPIVTTTGVSAPAVRRGGQRTLSTQASPTSRAGSGTTDTGIPSATRLAMASDTSPAVGRPSEKSTKPGTCPGSSSDRACRSARSRSVVSRRTGDFGLAGSSAASSRSAAVDSITVASAPNATMRQCAGFDFGVERVDLRRGLGDRAARDAVRDVHEIDDGHPRRAHRDHRTGQRQRERREEQRSADRLKHLLARIEVGAAEAAREPHERQRREQPQRAWSGQ